MHIVRALCLPLDASRSASCASWWQVASAEADDNSVRLELQPSKGDGAGETMTADVVLVSTGACGLQYSL